MITITEASIYSTKGEMAYEITYSEGTVVRVVVGSGLIRKEYKDKGEWKQSGKPYVVKHNARRQAERLVDEVKKFLAA